MKVMWRRANAATKADSDQRLLLAACGPADRNAGVPLAIPSRHAAMEHLPIVVAFIVSVALLAMLAAVVRHHRRERMRRQGEGPLQLIGEAVGHRLLVRKMADAPAVVVLQTHDTEAGWSRGEAMTADEAFRMGQLLIAAASGADAPVHR